MKVAALYDIHGNLPALEAVLREIQQAGVDQIVVEDNRLYLIQEDTASGR